MVSPLTMSRRMLTSEVYVVGSNLNIAVVPVDFAIWYWYKTESFINFDSLPDGALLFSVPLKLSALLRLI